MNELKYIPEVRELVSFINETIDSRTSQNGQGSLLVATDPFQLIKEYSFGAGYIEGLKFIRYLIESGEKLYDKSEDEERD